MKKKVIIGIVILIIFQGIKVTLYHQMTLGYGQGRVEVNINISDRQDYMTLKLEEGYSEVRPMLISTKHVQILGKITQEVLCIGTNEYCSEVEWLQMKNGSFWYEAAMKEGRNVVVISDTLARALFGSDKGTGNICAINDVPYQVVGVYQKYGRIGDEKFDDGRERIYVPLTSKVVKDQVIESMIIGTEKRDIKVSNILEKLKINTNTSKVYSESNMDQKLKNLLWLVPCISKDNVPPNNLFDIKFYQNNIKERKILHNYWIQLGISNFKITYTMVYRWMMILNLGQLLVLLNLTTVIIRWIRAKGFRQRNHILFKKMNCKIREGLE